MSLIEKFITTIEKRSSSCRSEEELRHLFLSELESLLHKLGLSVQPRLEETVQMGRSDARIGAIIYEFKKPFRLDNRTVRKEALGEIRRYLNAVSIEKEIVPSKLQGLITDGRTTAFLAYNSAINKFVTVDFYERPVKEEEAFYPIHKSLMWFERSINSLSLRELSPENLLEDFGPTSTICRSMVKLLWEEFHNSKSPSTKQPFYEQWKILFSTATQKVTSSKDLNRDLKHYGIDTNSFHDYKGKEGQSEKARVFLYIIHTYYSLILKLLAVRIADELRLLSARAGYPKKVLKNPW